MKIDAIIAQFELQNSWYLYALESISDKESEIIPAENLNPVKWVAGHILNTRLSMLNILIQKPAHEKYQKLFGKGSSGKLDLSFLSIDKIKEDWVTIATELKIALQNADQEKLLAKPPFQTSIPDETLLGLIAYFSMHESFHIGQLSVLRKLVGKQPMNMGRK